MNIAIVTISMPLGLCIGSLRHIKHVWHTFSLILWKPFLFRKKARLKIIIIIIICLFTLIILMFFPSLFIPLRMNCMPFFREWLISHEGIGFVTPSGLVNVSCTTGVYRFYFSLRPKKHASSNRFHPMQWDNLNTNFELLILRMIIFDYDDGTHSNVSILKKQRAKKKRNIYDLRKWSSKNNRN